MDNGGLDNRGLTVLPSNDIVLHSTVYNPFRSLGTLQAKRETANLTSNYTLSVQQQFRRTSFFPASKIKLSCIAALEY